MPKHLEIDARVVGEIEALLENASAGTRAAVAAITLPGRIRAFSPHYAALAPDDQKRLALLAQRMMDGRGYVESATGISAALAINHCEKSGHDYSVVRRGEQYFVERLP